MEHSEFVANRERPEFIWGVKGFYRPVFRICGRAEGIFVVSLSVAVVACTVGYATWVVNSGSYGALIWLLPIAYGYLTAHPGLNGIEFLLFVGIAFVGLLLGAQHIVGGLLPGLSWFAMGAIKGMTIVGIGARLASSKSAFETARDDGILLLPAPNKALQPSGEDAGG